MEVEDFFCSKVRMRILRLLFRLRQLNTTDLARRVGTNYEITLKHLVLLEKEEIVEHRLSGRAGFFRLANSQKAQALLMLLQEWEA
jgi:predicted transcriptional regulator